jgi:hypothetical protein
MITPERQKVKWNLEEFPSTWYNFQQLTFNSIKHSTRQLQLEVTAFLFYEKQKFLEEFGCPFYRISHGVYYTHKVERGTTKEREDFKMNIYEKGYNLDNIDVYMAYERNDSLVDDFFQYSTLARDAYMESLRESVYDIDRCYY